MAMTADTVRIFEDARLMHNLALSLMNTGDVRDAAEKAWCAVKRATDGLIAQRTGREPRTSAQTSRDLRALAHGSGGIADLRVRYRERLSILHGECFYYGLCDPIDEIVALIRETGQFIADAERLAEGN